jgi:hypothetical protein
MPDGRMSNVAVSALLSSAPSLELEGAPERERASAGHIAQLLVRLDFHDLRVDLDAPTEKTLTSRAVVPTPTTPGDVCRPSTAVEDHAAFFSTSARTAKMSGADRAIETVRDLTGRREARSSRTDPLTS